MHQAVKEELVQTLERLSAEQLLAVWHFACSIERQGTVQGVSTIDVSDAEAERAVEHFVAAAGCGQSGDPHSALRVDDVLYSPSKKP